MKLSQNQLDRIRLMYAFGLMVNEYRNLKKLIKIFFEEGDLNPEWMKLFDVLGRRDEYSAKNFLGNWQKKELEKTGKTTMGLLKIRKTEKGYLIYMNLAKVKK